MKFLFMLLLFISVNAKDKECNLLYSPDKCLDKTSLSKSHATVVLQNFLNIPGQYASLFNYHQNSLAVAPYFKKGKLSVEDLKMALFFALGVYANGIHSAAFSQMLISELIGVYKSNKKETLNILRYNPLFVEATCFYLSSYFGFKEIPERGRQDFWKSEKVHFKEFYKDGVKKCDRYFNQKGRLSSPYRI